MDKKIVLYVLIGIAILVILVMTFFPNWIYAVRDSGPSSGDKCSPPVGQTEEAWQEHMSHHPDIYKECLN